ncbi:L-seryl-tRNA(Sec) selenium transferase, partial [Burkholderia pseudomallei]
MSGPGASELNALLARAPSVERVLSSEEMQPLVDEYGRTRALAAVRASLAAWRDAARRDPAAAGTPDDARIAADVRARL